ncbi:unnamed protein product [Prunus armeniaca]
MSQPEGFTIAGKRDNNIGQCVVGYMDFNYAGDLDKCRSTTFFLFTLAGGPVSWRSTLQFTVALSTTEVEYMAVTEAIRGAIWLQGLIDDLGFHKTIWMFIVIVIVQFI